MQNEIKKAEENGENSSLVKEYYIKKANSIENGDNDFYQKVKSMLDTVGEVPDAIGRLTDKKYYETLSYEEKQRYTLSLSEKYLKAVERYKAENKNAFSK